MSSALIQKYFKDLSEDQIAKFDQLYDLYSFWNAQINVISRKDIEELYERHILHSLGIAKFCAFKPGEKVLDVGTGGGFPGIPLAILFPETQFHLVDSIGKKIRVVDEISSSVKLENLRATHARAEQINDKFHFIVSRAVTRLGDFYPWVKGKFEKESRNVLPNGVLYLKGGDLQEEILEAKLKRVKLYPLSSYFSEDFFETKFVVYFPAQ
ncbi:MAG TPA: 16S rRNA (guanine(527)-N(7))-methyltransferase RsmG [Pedobacter sp.]